jgi:beta-phosphoglucomutase-like phosphatase (HAD superfamily)
MESFLAAKAKMDEIVSSTSVRESAYIAYATTSQKSGVVTPVIPTIGIIFDMDGTLTEPGAIDFSEMYRRTGFVAGTGDLVSMVNAVTDDGRRQELEDIIVDEEMKGCDRMILRPDLHIFFTALRKHRIRTALATRNCYLAYERFAKNAEFPEEVCPTFISVF